MATFQEAFNYAKQNPDSDFAKGFAKHILSGKADEDITNSGINGDSLKQSLSQKYSDPQDKPAAVEKQNTGIPGVLAGVAKGVASTAVGVSELGTKLLRPIDKATDVLAQKITGKESNIKLLPSEDDYEKIHNDLKAETPSEKLGKGAEQIAEFFVPAAKVSTVEKILSGGAKTNILAKLVPIVGENIANKIASAASLGTKMAVRAAEGGGIVAAQTGGDLKDTKTAAIASSIFPAGGALMDAVGNSTKSIAPKIINSLIKPLLKDFSYGKNPGRAVAELGITAGTLDELATKIGSARKQIGEKLGSIYRKASEISGKTIDLTPQIEKLDNAIQEAAIGGKNNQGVVSRLQNIKDALLHEHSIDADGNITKSSSIPRDLSSLTPEEAFNFKKMIGDMTQFTGNASDDKAVNRLLKDIYGGTKSELNSTVKSVDPEIEKLNEQYADLTSAEVAAKYRDKIEARQNLISLPSNIVGLGSAIATAVATGGAAIPAILAGASGIALEKSVSTPSVKTAVAKWLASSTPKEKQILFKAVPALRGAIIKVLTGGDDEN